MGAAVLSEEPHRDHAATTTLTSASVPSPSPSPRTTSTAATPPTPVTPVTLAPVTLTPVSETTDASESAHPASLSLSAGTIRASHILVAYAGASASRETRSRAEARARAKGARARTATGEPFGLIAREYSDDATRSRGGDLGAFSRSKFPASFTAAAFALEPGEISDVVETRFGFHVIRRTQ